MNSFIRSDQYHLIEEQAKTILNGQLSTTDHDVNSALKALAQEKVTAAFRNLTNEQKNLIHQVEQIRDEGDAIFYLSRLKQYVIPFPVLTPHTIKKLFPKVKKLSFPSLNGVSWSDLTFFSWNEPGSQRKYLVTYEDGKLKGVRGHFVPSRQQGICSICREQENIGLFTTSTRGKETEETISRGNYICLDSVKCNQNIKTLTHYHQFIQRIAR